MYFCLFIGKSWYTITIWVLSCFCLYCMNKILQICEIHVRQCDIAAFGARKVHGFSFFLKAIPQYSGYECFEVETGGTQHVIHLCFVIAEHLGCFSQSKFLILQRARLVFCEDLSVVTTVSGCFCLPIGILQLDTSTVVEIIQT